MKLEQHKLTPRSSVLDAGGKTGAPRETYLSKLGPETKFPYVREPMIESELNGAK